MILIMYIIQYNLIEAFECLYYVELKFAVWQVYAISHL
jgi:hypothetical protein